MENLMSSLFHLKLLLSITLAVAWLAVGGLSAHAQTNPANLAPIILDDSVGYINGKGELLIPPRFDQGWPFAKDGLAPVQVKGKWGRLNPQGQFAIPPRFGGICAFAGNGLACAEENGKWGFIDRQGQFIIPPRFDDAREFAANGLAPDKA
jgi:hypothetical protein